MLSPERFAEIAADYGRLRVAVVGDYCLDRYLEIDPARQETSIETALPVHNVVRVRAQPGGAGTILDNLAALGVGTLHAVGFCGDDGEGYELRRALAKLPAVRLERFVTTSSRATFTYAKPLIVEGEQPPRELNRLDIKNWTATPSEVTASIVNHVRELARELDALVLLDQVDEPETGVLTAGVLAAIGAIARERPGLWLIADSRQGLARFPRVVFKMNRAELGVLAGKNPGELSEIKAQAAELAARNNKHAFITLAEAGIVGAAPDGEVQHAPSLPVRGPIDVVGAGDSVTANLAAALASGASLLESIEIANLAASVIVHKVGTTGSASAEEIAKVLASNARMS